MSDEVKDKPPRAIELSDEQIVSLMAGKFVTIQLPRSKVSIMRPPCTMKRMHELFMEACFHNAVTEG